METKVKITTEESEQVENLFMYFTSYCNLLGYLSNYGSLDTDIFDKKWEEAIRLDQQLTSLKEQLDKKYHPQDGLEYESYKFNFTTAEMIYNT